MQLLPWRGTASLRPDGAIRDAGQAALHLPFAGGRRRDRHRRELPGRRTVLVHRARPGVWEHDRLEACRIHPRDRRGIRTADPARGDPDRCLPAGPRRGGSDVRGHRARPRRRGTRQGGVHRLLRGGQADRRGLRTASPVTLPRAGWQEPARRDAGRRPRLGRRGRSVQRLRDGRSALHVARHGDRASRRPRRLHRAILEGRDGCPHRRPDPGRPLRSDDLGPILRTVRALARADPPSSHRVRVGRDRAHHLGEPANGIRGRPGRRPLLPPRDRRRGHARRRALPDGDVRADRGRRLVRHLRSSDGARERARLRPLEQHLHERPAQRLPFPRPDLRGDGEREQLHVGRGGTPAVRRQRPLRQREPAVGDVGPRPVHPMAGDELGLLGKSPEGRRWIPGSSRQTRRSVS